MKHKVAVMHKHSDQVIDGLSHLLADTYVLYLKTQNFHWNVTGPHFREYHKLFEEQYKALAEATDLIAERIRALNAPAPASFAKFLMLTSLNEAGHMLVANKMIKDLLHDHELVAKNITKAFVIAEKTDDQVTLDLLIQRKTEHDKFAWMLRSTLEHHE